MTTGTNPMANKRGEGPLRIVVLADAFLPYISGVSVHCIDLASSLLAAGHEVMILAPRQEQEPSIPDELQAARIVYLPSFPVREAPGLRMCYPNLPGVLRAIWRFRPDIIETHAPSPLGFDGLLASKLLRIPCSSNFTTLLSSKPYLQLVLGRASYDLFERTAWVLLRWFYNASDQVVVFTEGIRQLLIEHGIAQEKIVRLAPLMDLRSMKQLDESARARLKQRYGLRDKVAVFVGRLSPEKSLQDLLRAWVLVCQALDDATLLLVGDGSHEPQLRRLTQELGLEEQVVFTGSIEHRALISSGLLSVCDVFVSPSVSETFGLSGLEAMAHGKPVVLAASQGLSEWTSEAGMLFPPGDIHALCEAILELLNNPNLRNKLGSGARRIATKHDRESAIKGYVASYADLVADAGGKRRLIPSH